MSSKPATPLEQRRGYPGENESTRIPVLSPTPFRRSYSLRMRTSRSFHDYQHYRDVDVGCCVCDYGGVGASGSAMHHPTNLSSPSTSGGVKVKNSLANGPKPASHHHHHARDTSAPGQSPQDTTGGGKDTLLPNGIVGHGHHGHHHHGSNNNGSCGQKSLCSSSQSTRKNSLQKNDRGMVSGMSFFCSGRSFFFGEN